LADFQSEIVCSESENIKIAIISMNCAGDMPDSALEIVPAFKEGLEKVN